MIAIEWIYIKCRFSPRYIYGMRSILSRIGQRRGTNDPPPAARDCHDPDALAAPVVEIPDCVLDWEPYCGRLPSGCKETVHSVQKAMHQNALSSDSLTKNPKITTEVLLLAGATASVLHAAGVGVRAAFRNDDASGARLQLEHVRRRLSSFGLHFRRDLLDETSGSWSFGECAGLVSPQERGALGAGLGLAPEDLGRAEPATHVRREYYGASTHARRSPSMEPLQTSGGGAGGGGFRC